VLLKVARAATHAHVAVQSKLELARLKHDDAVVHRYRDKSRQQANAGVSCAARSSNMNSPQQKDGSHIDRLKRLPQLGEFIFSNASTSEAEGMSCYFLSAHCFDAHRAQEPGRQCRPWPASLLRRRRA
jgi:hypothetical protein